MGWRALEHNGGQLVVDPVFKHSKRLDLALVALGVGVLAGTDGLDRRGVGLEDVAPILHFDKSKINNNNFCLAAIVVSSGHISRMPALDQPRLTSALRAARAADGAAAGAAKMFLLLKQMEERRALQKTRTADDEYVCGPVYESRD